MFQKSIIKTYRLDRFRSSDCFHVFGWPGIVAKLERVVEVVTEINSHKLLH